jgi:hypothetical protein
VTERDSDGARERGSQRERGVSEYPTE